MWVPTTDLPVSPGHPFYARLNAILDEAGFDRFAEEQCRPFYAPVSSMHLRSGRPNVSVGVARPKLRARTVPRVPPRITQGRAGFGRSPPGGPTMPPAAPAFVGVDVAKAELVIASRPSGARWTVANDDGGIRGWLYLFVVAGARNRQTVHFPSLQPLEMTVKIGVRCRADCPQPATDGVNGCPDGSATDRTFR